MSLTVSNPAASAQQIIRSLALRRHVIVLVLFLLVVSAAVISIGVGTASISVPRTIMALTGTGSYGDHLIITQFRLPRVLVGICVGAALAVSGVILQAITRNALAEPSIVGINGGAGLGAILVLSYVQGVSVAVLAPVAAFGGAAVAGGLAYLLARKGGIANPARLALIGVAFGGMALALIQLVIVFTVYTGDIQVALQWLAGSLWDRSWSNVWEVAPAAVILVPVAWFAADQLNLIGLGNDLPRSLGARLERLKLGLLAVAVLLAASAVAVAGTISFVGLLAPHICRRLVGPGHRLLIPAAACLGALLVTVADTVGRSILPPAEIPVGMFTALIGAPYFLFQIRKGLGK